MYGGLNRLVASAFVAAAVIGAAALITAPAAFACSGGPSAYNVYKECLSNGGSGGGKHNGGGGGGSGSSTPTGGSHTGSSNTSQAPDPKAKKAIAQAGKDGDALKDLYEAGGGTRFLASHGSTPTSEPTAIGSAFDLGSGPTALLLVLAGSAVLLLGASGVRLWRQQHRA